MYSRIPLVVNTPSHSFLPSCMRETLCYSAADSKKKTCGNIEGPVKWRSISQTSSTRSMGVSSVRTTCPRDCKDDLVVGSPSARHDATVTTSCRHRTDWLRRPAPRDAGSASMLRRAGCVARCCVPVRHLLASSMLLVRAAGNPRMTSAHHSLPSRMGTTSVLVRHPPAATSALAASVAQSGICVPPPVIRLTPIPSNWPLMKA